MNPARAIQDSSAGVSTLERPAGGLRVCMVHHSDFHVDSRIQRQARALAERGDEVHLVCLSDPGVEHVGLGRIVLHRVGGQKAGGGVRGYVGGYARFLLGAMRQVTALDHRGRLDLVEAHNMPDILTAAAIVPRLRGTPVILNVHDTFPELFATKFEREAGHPAVRAVYVQERLAAAMADRVITVTETFRDVLDRRGIGDGRITVVMNAPDERAFGPARTPRELPADGPVRVLYHGGLAPRFGADVLVQAAAQLDVERPVEVRICGTGDEDRLRVAALAREIAPDRVDVAPEVVPFADIPAELEAAHIGVVPTIRDGFTEMLLPVKLLEYVHMGLPAVSSELPGIRRHFGDDDLLFTPPGDAAALAAAIRGVIASPDRSRERALSASRRLTGFAWAGQRDGYLALVDELVAERRR